jgi:uncharacterized protein YkwD
VALSIALLAALLLAAPPADAREDLRSAMLRELNRVRAQYGLPAMRGDRRLHGAAWAHSRDMAVKRSFAHGAWGSRVKAASGRARSVGEVIGWLALGNPRAEATALVRAWLASPPHRQAMLTREFRRVGIGRVTGSVGGQRAALYTVDFASAR